jgi:hypothetical protein
MQDDVVQNGQAISWPWSSLAAARAQRWAVLA